MWEKVFNGNNPIWQSMGTVFDLFVLNLVWVISCIPIVTIGPATAALFYTLIERMRGGGSYVMYDYKRSFVKNLKQGIKLSLPFTLLEIFLLLDMYMCYHAGRGIFTFFLFFFGIMLFFVAATELYALPLLGKFDRTNKELIIWGFTLSIKHFGTTIMMMLVIAVLMWFCHIVPALLFIAFGMAAQFCATMMATIFKPYYPKDEEEYFAEIADMEDPDMDDIKYLL